MTRNSRCQVGLSSGQVGPDPPRAIGVDACAARGGAQASPTAERFDRYQYGFAPFARLERRGNPTFRIMGGHGGGLRAPGRARAEGPLLGLSLLADYVVNVLERRDVGVVSPNLTCGHEEFQISSAFRNVQPMVRSAYPAPIPKSRRCVSLARRNSKIRGFHSVPPVRFLPAEHYHQLSEQRASSGNGQNSIPPDQERAAESSEPVEACVTEAARPSRE